METQNDNKTGIVIVVLGILIIVAGLLFFFFSKKPEDSNMPKDNADVTNVEEKIIPKESTSSVTTTKSFIVVGSNYKFDVAEIKVKKGDKVSLTFKNEVGMHDWKLDEFKASTKVIKAGEQEMIEFIADKAGTFEYYCSVGQHRANGMKGNLIVEE